MNREEIDKLLSGENDEVLVAHSEIVAIQKDKSNLLKFGVDWIDDNLIGGLNNKITFFGSRPSNGKTHHCSTTINNLLNREINPTEVNILRCNLEMPTAALLLREVSKVLGRKPSSILHEPYSEAERPLVEKVVNSFRDDRITNMSTPLIGEDYKYMLSKFLEKVNKKDTAYNLANSDKPPRKTKKVVLTDHLHCYLNKESIDSILSIQNSFKMTDENLSFVNYFQLNRDTEQMWRETKEKKVNPKNMLPNSGSIYLTDLLQQFADIVVGMVIPQIYELDEYVAVHKERNIHLSEHFVDNNDDNSFVRLKGRNRIYYNFIKIRMLDDFDDPRLFCQVLNPEYEKTAEKIYQENKQPFTKSTLSIPVFNETIVFEKESPVPLASLAEAFGEVSDKKVETPPF